MPEIKHQITTGNLYQIGVMLVALALGWAAMDARGNASQKAVADHEDRLRTLERDVIGGLAQINVRLSRIEIDMKGASK